MLNKLQIIGRVGADPEMRYMSNGDAVVSFSVATTDKWKDKSGEMKEETEWHKCGAFGRLAEIIGEYVKKGSLVYIEGKVKTRKYTDKDGVEKYSTEVRANEMKLLGSKQEVDSHQRERQQEQPRQPQRQQRQPARQQSAYDNGFDDTDGDIPF
jgi:single-strand DNA-binding protein